MATSLRNKKIIVVSMRTTSRNEFLENPTNGIFQFFDKLKKWNKFKESDLNYLLFN